MLDALEVGARGLAGAGGGDPHAALAAGILLQLQLDRPLVHRRGTLHQGEVALVDGMDLEAVLHLPGRLLGARQQEGAAGALVEAMDDEGAWSRGVLLLPLPPQERDHRVGVGIPALAGGRQARRLGGDAQGLVLPEDRQLLLATGAAFSAAGSGACVVGHGGAW